MSAYDQGYLVGKLVGYLIAGGLLFYFLYWRKRKKKNDNDNTLDQI